jgi:hypothetical protein
MRYSSSPLPEVAIPELDPAVLMAGRGHYGHARELISGAEEERREGLRRLKKRKCAGDSLQIVSQTIGGACFWGRHSHYTGVANQDIKRCALQQKVLS